MQFTQESLGKLVSRAFFKVDSSPVVIPMQGNFQNPQDEADGRAVWLQPGVVMAKSEKPQTWIGFEKRDSSPLTYPFMAHDNDGTDTQNPTEYSVVFKTSMCRLQIVGAQSEEWAEWVAHWLNRSDVAAVCVELDCTLLADGLGRVETSVFWQEGLNVIWAYNVYFKVEWASTIDAAEGDLITQAIPQGIAQEA